MVRLTEDLNREKEGHNGLEAIISSFVFMTSTAFQSQESLKSNVSLNKLTRLHYRSLPTRFKLTSSFHRLEIWLFRLNLSLSTLIKFPLKEFYNSLSVVMCSNYIPRSTTTRISSIAQLDSFEEGLLTITKSQFLYRTSIYYS